MGDGFFFPACTAMRPSVLPADHLLAANGIEGTLRPTIMQAGPLLASAVVAATSPAWAFLVVAITQVLADGALLGLRSIPLSRDLEGEHGDRPPIAAMLLDVGAGFRYMVRTGWLFGLLLQRRVPSPMLGRVSSLDWLVSLLFMPISMALAGPIGEAVGFAPAFLAATHPGASPLDPASRSAEAGVMAQLIRPRTGRVIGGVCAAIAHRFGWNVTVVRVLTVLSLFIPGPQLIFYLIAWFVIPSEPARIVTV